MERLGLEPESKLLACFWAIKALYFHIFTRIIVTTWQKFWNNLRWANLACHSHAVERKLLSADLLNSYILHRGFVLQLLLGKLQGTLKQKHLVVDLHSLCLKIPPSSSQTVLHGKIWWMILFLKLGLHVPTFLYNNCRSDNVRPCSTHVG